MNEVHDEKLSQLVSLGGWLRGTQVLTAVVDRHFSADGAELLHQPDLLDYFQRKLANMPEFNVPLLDQIKSALVEVKPLIDVDSPISRRIGEEDQRDHFASRRRHRHAKTMKPPMRPPYFHHSSHRPSPPGVACLQVAASRASVDDAHSFALQCSRTLRQGRLSGARRLLGRRPRGGGEEGGPATTFQGERLLVLDGHGSGAGQSLGPYLRRRRQACASSPTAGRKGISPPPISCPRRRGVISSSWRWRVRRKSAPTGRWFTVSGRRSASFA